MSLASGTRLGPYEILAPIGAGGMGEVYRGRDTRLERTVAIKVLPEKLAQNPEYRQRLEREARAVAALNHPHICTLHDIGQQDGIDFLVFEYLEGETLAARLAKGRMPLEETLRCAAQVADALDKAHRKDLTHRDLKPGNIMLTKGGAKLLDFGLAKTGARPAAAGATQSPTADAGLTVSGTILGTLQYMSPEQLHGKPVDARSDIFSYGAVLYEMATGQKAFPGETQASVIAAILTAEPKPISTLEPMSPPALDRVVKKCLAKDPDERWQAAADVMNLLQWIGEGGTETAPPSTTHQPPSPKLAWVVAAGLALLLAAVSALYFRRPPTVAPGVMRFTVSLPEKATGVRAVAVSPDGRHVAYGAIVEGRPGLWLRSLDSVALRPLPGTEGGVAPFWSPDSRFLGYWALDGKLKKIDIAGGPPQTLCDPRVFAGADWSPEGVILFGDRDGLYRVPAAGGVPAQVTKLDPSRQEIFHGSPQFFPDGRRFLYLAASMGEAEGTAIYAASLDSGKDGKDRKRLLATDGKAEYAPPRNEGPGHLLFVREGTLMAQAFDDAKLELSGDPFPVAEQVRSGRQPGRGAGTFSASPSGLLAYITGSGTSATRRLVWLDRAGKPLGTLGPPGAYSAPRLSPDDKRVAVDQVDSTGNSDIWVFDLARGTNSRFTFNDTSESNAVWSPDGSRIAFSSRRDGAHTIYQKDASGVGNEELLLKTDQRPVGLQDWSRDGRFLVFDASGGGNSGTRRDLWALPLAGDRKPFPIIQVPFGQYYGRLSPDGKFIAYASDESQRTQVYVHTFTGTPAGSGGKWMVSTEGGEDPHWRRDGKELFYLTPDNKMMAVAVKTGPTFEAGIPQPLFEIEAVASGRQNAQYTVTGDGQRFLVVTEVEQTGLAPITVVVNWK